MALSGSFQYLPNGKFGVVCNWTGTQDIPNNRTKITINVYLRVWTVSVGARTGTYNVGGNTGNWSASALSVSSASAYTDQWLGTVEKYVNHNSSGTANNVALQVVYPFKGTYSGTYYESITASTTVNLDTIPRYATITQSMASRTETTITMNWTADATVDKLWYSINNGSSWTEVSIAQGTSGSYTISGLSAYTQYTIKTRVRRKDSQLTSDSSAYSQYTYPYPYANSMPNFTIGNKLTLGFYNPLGRTITVKFIDANNATQSSWEISGTSISGYNDTSFCNALYSSIPNATSGTYKVQVTYGSQTNTKTGGTYSINTSDCTPTINSLAYQDTNSSVVNVTGNNQKIVRNHSTVRYTASGLSVKNSATIASCKVSVNGNTYTLTVSGTSATGGNAVIDSGSDVTATVTLTDSRGLQATKSVTVTMLDWQLPTGVITLQRANNFYSETTIKCDARYSSLDGTNTITITYACTKEGDSSASVTGTLSDNVAVTKTLDNNYDWTVKFTLVDALGGRKVYNVFLSRGTPIIFFDRKQTAVGFGAFPDASHSVEGGSDWNIVMHGKNNKMEYMPYSYATAGITSGTGFERIARIAINNTYMDAPLEFVVTRRGDSRSVRFWVKFANANSADPDVDTFYYEGIDATYRGASSGYFTAFITKADTSTWDIYVHRQNASDRITVVSNIPAYIQNRCAITYPDGYLASAPSGAVWATNKPCLSKTVTITKTSGNSNVSDIGFWRDGNVCQLYFNCTASSAITVGSDMFVGMADAPLPVSWITNFGYYASTSFAVSMSVSGQIKIRILSADLANNSTLFVSLIYLTNE